MAGEEIQFRAFYPLIHVWIYSTSQKTLHDTGADPLLGQFYSISVHEAVSVFPSGKGIIKMHNLMNSLFFFFIFYFFPFSFKLCPARSRMVDRWTSQPVWSWLVQCPLSPRPASSHAKMTASWPHGPSSHPVQLIVWGWGLVVGHSSVSMVESVSF